MNHSGNILVTTAEIAGNWFVVKFDKEAKTKELVKTDSTEQAAAYVAARKFASENNFRYVNRAVIINLPVMSIWPVNEGWIPVEIDYNDIRKANRVVAQEKAEALATGKQLADERELEFFPWVGKSMSKKSKATYIR